MTIRHNSPSPFRRRAEKPLRALVILAAVVGASSNVQSQPETPANSEAGTLQPVEGTSAIDFLQDARTRLSEYRTLQAKISETIEFGPRRFQAKGSYLQGAGNRVNLDVSVTLGENSGRLRQISEGDVLWTVYDIGEIPKITRRDVKQILAAAQNANTRAMLAQDLGLGGLPALLAAVEQSMDFEQPLKTQIDGRDFIVLQGQWNAAIAEQFKAQLAQVGQMTGGQASLPPQVPDRVRIYLDAESLFPYRIRYLKDSPAPGMEPAPLLTLDFSEIVANASLNPSDFRYSPPEGAEVADLTRMYVQQLQAAAAAPAQQPPAEPAAQSPPQE